MKQYLDKQKCEELMKLGFPFPDSYDVHVMDDVNKLADFYPAVRDDEGWLGIYENYDIGDILEFLPSMITVNETIYNRIIDGSNIVKYYSWSKESTFIVYYEHLELIDNLYELCVILKKKKII